jgi:hypothetical protein
MSMVEDLGQQTSIDVTHILPSELLLYNGTRHMPGNAAIHERLGLRFSKRDIGSHGRSVRGIEEVVSGLMSVTVHARDLRPAFEATKGASPTQGEPKLCSEEQCDPL